MVSGRCVRAIGALRGVGKVELEWSTLPIGGDWVASSRRQRVVVDAVSVVIYRRDSIRKSDVDILAPFVYGQG